MPWVYPISFVDWLDSRKDRRKHEAASSATAATAVIPNPTSSTPNTATPSTISFATLPTRSNANRPADRSLDRDIQALFGSSTGTLASGPVSRSGSSVALSASSSSLVLPRSLEQRVALESRSFELLGEVSLGARVMGERRRSMRDGRAGSGV
ncbi:hypothetical protein LTR57_011823 [Friedmanniomyces endolithicus]|nr:hypothetical protein LTR94_000046 [Friedmanniomyces endolithicus]KAK0816233.1 hypothetical protein LTR38_002215 [Friedmanniomyces endolithicus]KAK0851305.1 hypothetical protein LTR03_004092 [Friedmanniomyces endolithicus]KAK0868664.1 hypothetical protein LTS02_003505 [Friedmanniomyces endolithicus]KAK0884117.1 hypothetical protein LTR87_002056 [Friedmanniomyces endolithicus]